MNDTQTKSTTFTDPLNPMLVPEDDKEWREWFKETRDASKIMEEIDQCGGDTLAQKILPRQIIMYGHWLGYMLAIKLKYAQLRRFVDALKDIERKGDLETRKKRLTLFQIQLVHGLSRQKALEPFFIIIKGIIHLDIIKNEEDFERFMSLVDSITAYFEIFEDKSKRE